MPSLGDAALGIAETIGPDGPRPSARARGESKLRARIEAGESLAIGRFEVLGMIGTGGMSVVCRARDPDLDREVAIKLLQGHAALGDEGRTRLQREARAMAKLSHPNVATVFEVGVHEGEVFVAMELVHGQTLRAWRDAHASDERAILAMYVAAGEGLAAAHAAGFVHRDFKPDNVIVGDDGRARVLDFGLAAVLGEAVTRTAETIDGDRQGTLTMTGAVLGTPAYMAPEQHRSGTVDARTDQFAFCIALWEALTGERPFAGATIYEIAANVCFGTITPPSRPLRVEAVLRRGLAVRPSERYASMRELLDALADATRPRGAPKWIAVAAIAAMLGVGAVAALLPSDDATEPIAPATSDVPVSPATPVAIVDLTRTPGLGIAPAPLFMDGAAQRVVYRVGDELLIRESADTPPEPLAWPNPELTPLAFDDDGTGYVGHDAQWIYRVRTGATAERLAFAARPRNAFRVLAPDLSALFLFDRERASLQHAGAEPIAMFEGRNVELASWSADGRRLAAVLRRRADMDMQLVVLDASGNVLHERSLTDEYGGEMVWLGETLAMIHRDSAPLQVACWAVTDEGIAAPFARELDLPLGVGAVAQQGSAHGDLLLRTSQTSRDVAVLALTGEEPPQLLHHSPDLEANNERPAWIDDEHLAYISDRFAGGTAMIDDRLGGHARVDARFEGDAVACAVAGTATLCVVEDAHGDGSLVAAERDRPARKLGPAPGLKAIECANASTCIGLVMPDERPAEIHAIDPVHGTLTRRFVCPAELQCLPERIALARDGRSILMVDGKNVHRLDATTGVEIGVPLRAAGAQASVQSASEFLDGSLVVTDIVDGDKVPRYRVVNLRKGVGHVVWERRDRWLIRPRLSPDGRHLALTSMAFHHEAAIAKNACGK